MSSCPYARMKLIVHPGGTISHDYELGENPDFLVLLSCRDTVLKYLGWTMDQMEVSMGMSSDYLHAISKGSTNVRVGSTIFGARQYKVTWSPGRTKSPFSVTCRATITLNRSPVEFIDPF